MSALPSAEALPLRCRVLVELEVVDDGRTWTVRPQIWQGHEEVRLNQVDGSVSICARGHWLRVGAHEMRWLDPASAERQAAISGGFAALLDLRVVQERLAVAEREGRAGLGREAVVALTELRERLESAASLTNLIDDKTADRAHEQLHAAGKAVDMALDRVRALTNDDIPF